MEQINQLKSSNEIIEMYEQAKITFKDLLAKNDGFIPELFFLGK